MPQTTNGGLSDLGKPLSASDFRKRLEKIAPTISIRPSARDISKCGIYHNDNRFICGMESGIDLKPIYEYSQVIFTSKHGQVTSAKEIRGWRTVLTRLIQTGVITKTAAEREFGPPNSKDWQRHTGSY